MRDYQNIKFSFQLVYRMDDAAEKDGKLTSLKMNDGEKFLKLCPTTFSGIVHYSANETGHFKNLKLSSRLQRNMA